MSKWIPITTLERFPKEGRILVYRPSKKYPHCYEILSYIVDSTYHSWRNLSSGLIYFFAESHENTWDLIKTTFTHFRVLEDLDSRRWKKITGQEEINKNKVGIFYRPDSGKYDLMKYISEVVGSNGSNVYEMGLVHEDNLSVYFDEYVEGTYTHYYMVDPFSN